MNTEPPGRRRTYVFPGRQKRLSIRVTDGEDAEITNAAHQLGLTPTGFCAHAALDAARTLHTGTTTGRMEHEALASLQAELFHTRVTLNQLRVTLNQLRAELEHTRNDTRATTDNLNNTITHATHALADLDTAISCIHRRLGQR